MVEVQGVKIIVDYTESMVANVEKTYRYYFEHDNMTTIDSIIKDLKKTVNSALKNRGRNLSVTVETINSDYGHTPIMRYIVEFPYDLRIMKGTPTKYEDYCRISYEDYKEVSKELSKIVKKDIVNLQKSTANVIY